MTLWQSVRAFLCHYYEYHNHTFPPTVPAKYIRYMFTALGQKGMNNPNDPATT